MDVIWRQKVPVEEPKEKSLSQYLHLWFVECLTICSQTLDTFLYGFEAVREAVSAEVKVSETLATVLALSIMVVWEKSLKLYWNDYGRGYNFETYIMANRRQDVSCTGLTIVGSNGWEWWDELRWVSTSILCLQYTICDCLARSARGLARAGPNSGLDGLDHRSGLSLGSLLVS